MPKDIEIQNILQAKDHQPSKAEFSMFESEMLVILMKLSYPFYHQRKLTLDTIYFFLFFFKKVFANEKRLF